VTFTGLLNTSISRFVCRGTWMSMSVSDEKRGREVAWTFPSLAGRQVGSGFSRICDL
jgi:hypothetical protein